MKVYVVYIWWQDEDIDGLKVFTNLENAVAQANAYIEEAISYGLDFDPREKETFTTYDLDNLHEIRKVYTNGDDVEQIVITEREVI